jgi:hypothetical protein
LPGATVLGSTFIGWIWPLIRGALLQARETGQISGRTICVGFLGFVAALVAPVIYTGVHVRRIGQRALDNEQFPPPGIRVIRDTHVMRGAQARNLGRVQRVLGLLLITCALALLGLSAYAAIRLL